MNKTAWIIFGVVCVALLSGLVWASQGEDIDVSNINIEKIQSASPDNGEISDHVFGNPDAKVKIIEYGDFQCPGCGSAAPVMKELSHKYDKQLAFIFRNYPLTSMHPNAMAAAAAAEAAGLQGKYWEMHDKLYANQSSWENLSGQARTNVFSGFASTIGIDKDKFISDLGSSKITKKIAFDRALGSKAGVTGTPTIFVNGKIADQSVKDGKLIKANNSDPLVWSNAKDFDNLVLKPAFEAAGVDIK